MRCRLCEAETALLADRGDLSLYSCPACGFVSGRPARERAPAERYHHYYASPAPPAPVSRYEEWIRDAESHVGKGRLLEVGAGAGGFVKVAIDRGWKAHATEISRTASDALRATGAEVFLGEVSAAQFSDATFDLVVALEVIEHLEQPASQLREWRRVLRPGGLLLVTTPNFRGLTGRLLGIRWRVVDPEHLGYFTSRTLAAALAAAGYSRARIASRSLDVFAWRWPVAGGAAASFDPARTADVRDRANRHPLLRRAKEATHAGLRLVGLGDTLLAWAAR
jgi:SAM-dependent methyltransferase